MANELKLTNSIFTALTAVSDNTDKTILDSKDYESRIAKIIVVNKEAADVSLTLSVKVDDTSNVVGVFSIPSGAGASEDVPPVEIVALSQISSEDNAGNKFFNMQLEELLQAKITGSETPDVQITVKGEYYD